MKKSSSLIKAACAQFAPVFLDKKATTDKACELISQASKKGAKLVVFPEAFIPAYPDWVWVVPPYKGQLLNSLYGELLKNSVTVPDETTAKLCRAAKKAKIYAAIGINERNKESSGSSLYNTMLYINLDGIIMGKHRKLVPTSAERLVWAQGDGGTMDMYDTKIGKLGGLICWENYMPLARYYLYSKGIQLYTAPTWDQSETWINSMCHIAKEGGMYVLSCCIAMKMEDIPARFGIKEFYPSTKGKWLAKGNSVIVNPKGEIIAGPLPEKENFIFADIDLSQISSAKRTFDAAGHYDRKDVFSFKKN
jgi:nitrilase